MTDCILPPQPGLFEQMISGADKAEWHLLPGHIVEGVRRYIEYGVPNGDFVTGCFEGNLFKAAMYADETNARALTGIARFIQWFAPTGSYGSKEAVEKWKAHKGLSGINKEA